MLAAGLLSLTITACQAQVVVGLDADADGGGRVRATVSLDRDAARRVPDLADRLEVGDLEQAGWTVSGPVETDEGGFEITATKPYETPAEAARVVAELSGPDGPFRDFEVTRDRSFLKTRTSFTGNVDLSGGVEQFSDDELTERLGGKPIGVDPAELERQLGVVLSRMFRVQVAVRLPGDVESNAPTTAGNGAVWAPKLGEHVRLQASAEQWNTLNIALAAVAVVSGLAFAAVVVRRVIVMAVALRP